MDNTTSDSATDAVIDSGRTVIDWFDNNLDMIFGVILIFVIAIIAAKVISEVIRKLLYRTIREDMYPSKTDRDRRLRTLTNITTAIISIIVWTVATLMILSTIGVDVGPLIASAGIISVAIGFGSQSLVKDFMTGMFIIAENQYRVGDYIEIQNVKGTVKAITLRTTIITDDDGSVFHVPNGSIIVTGNHTMSNNKVSIELSATTDTDIDKLRVIIDKTGKAQATHVAMKENITEPLHFVRIKEIASSAIVIRISGKVKPGQQAVVRSDYYTALQKELIKNKIALK
jgi:moderate conductance mechanosensitive channel